jgi:hypothetical protein
MDHDSNSSGNIKSKDLTPTPVTPTPTPAVQPLWPPGQPTPNSASGFPDVCSSAFCPGFLEKLSCPNRIRGKSILLDIKGIPRFQGLAI